MPNKPSTSSGKYQQMINGHHNNGIVRLTFQRPSLLLPKINVNINNNIAYRGDDHSVQKSIVGEIGISHGEVNNQKQFETEMGFTPDPTRTIVNEVRLLYIEYLVNNNNSKPQSPIVRHQYHSFGGSNVNINNNITIPQPQYTYQTQPTVDVNYYNWLAATNPGIPVTIQQQQPQSQNKFMSVLPDAKQINYTNGVYQYTN